MRESKKFRRNLLATLQADQPYCVYCCGSTLGDTVDHIPPITVFDLRRRPKGFEFLSCGMCNRGSKATDQVIGCISRVYPDASSPQARIELGKILRGVKNNHPGLLEEMLPSAEQERRFRRHADKVPDAGGALNVNGPLLNAAINSFAGKFGLAMHFYRTKRIVPVSGCIGVRWYSNYDALVGTLPLEFLKILAPPETLVQGRFEVPDQFSVSFVVTTEGGLSGHFATFRKSFAIVAIAAEDETKLDLDTVPSSHRIRPGWLKSNN